MNFLKITITAAFMAISSIVVQAQNQYKLVILTDFVGEDNKEGTIAGYKIDKSIELNKDQSKALLKEMKKKSNLIKESKRCKLTPTYAILLNDKPYATIDVKTCPKIMYFKDNEVEFKDLKVDHTVLKIIEGFIK